MRQNTAKTPILVNILYLNYKGIFLDKISKITINSTKVKRLNKKFDLNDIEEEERERKKGEEKRGDYRGVIIINR